jgi:hypothetical protein
MFKLERKMSYNFYQCEQLGFYPSLDEISEKKRSYKFIIIGFEYFKYYKNVYCWQQISGPVIYGFIKRHGQELLDSLNKEANVNAQIIKNCGGRTIFPLTYNSTYYILENYNNDF